MDADKTLLREIFADAVEISDPESRSKFLDAACRGNRDLRQRIERLLAADSSAGDFLSCTGSVVLSEKPGDCIGRYRLVERIGSGGGGVVYLAEQEEPVRRRVALKVLKLGMDTQAFVARFELERQALAMMDHPNIARVLDAGATDKGRPFFVMELVTGQRITDYCQRHELSLSQRLELFIPVCHAIQHAHQKGIIHRDLKPSNVLVTEHEGTAVPKVIDFGIAKATGHGAEEHVSLTNVGQMVGTPAFMSPEQMEPGKTDIDTRTDIYSLGVILYELVAGLPPFALAGLSLEETRHLVREVDPLRPSARMTTGSRRRSEAPRRPVSREQLAAIRGDLDWIIMKCLEKDRERRYETANDLAMDLRRHLENEPILAREPTQFYRLQKIVRRHRLFFSSAITVVLILICAVIVSTWLAWRASRAEHEQARLRALSEAKAAETRQNLIRRYVAEGNRLLEHNQPATALPWMIEALALEAGNTRREADERLRIAQAMIGAPKLELHLAQGRQVNSVALNPNGTLLASGSDDGMVRITAVASGNLVTNFVLPRDIGHLEFSADGTHLIAMDMGGHSRLWAATGGFIALGPDDEPGRSLGASNLSPEESEDVAESPDVPRSNRLRPAAVFSPDRNSFLLASGSKSAELRDAVTGRLLHKFRHERSVNHVAIDPGGRLAATSSDDNTARVWDLGTGKAAGPSLKHGGRVTFSQFSSDGTKLLTVQDFHIVQLWDWRTGRKLAPEIVRRSTLSFAGFNHDSTKIVTTAHSGFANVYDAATSRSLYGFDYQGGLMAAAFSPVRDDFAVACHDGNVWIRNGDDSSGDPMPLPEGNQIEEIAFSSDGRRLAVGTRGGHARVWDLSPPAPGVSRLPGNTVEWVDFSPLGHRALVLSTGQKSSLAVYETDSGKLVCLSALKPDQAEYARFSPDGRSILVYGRRPVVLVFSADTGQQTIPPLAHKDRLRDAVWSPNGRQIITAAARDGVRFWDVASGKLAVAIPNSNSVTRIAVSPDGARLAIGQNNNTMQLWSIPDNRMLGKPIVAPGKIWQIQFSPSGGRLAFAADTPGNEGMVEILECDSGKVVGAPLLHRDSVRAFAFSGNGQWLATVCEDHTARVWDAKTGEPISPPLPHDYEARQVVFSPDGLRLVTLARRGAVRLWNSRTGEPITPPLVYDRNAGSGAVSYSPDGKRLLLARGGDAAWLRELAPESSGLEQLKLQGDITSCMSFDPNAGMVPMDEAALEKTWKRLQAFQGKK